MSGDQLAWAGAAFTAALVHGALAFAATQMPAPTPPPQVEIEIEMLDLGGGLALQPSPVEAVMSGIAPQVMQQAAVEARQQPVESQGAVVAAQAATAVQQAALAPATTQAAPTAAIAPTVAATSTSAAPPAAAVQPIGAATPLTVHVTAPSASPVGAQTATAAQPAPAAQQGIATTGQSTIAPGSTVTPATMPLPAAAGVTAIAPAAAAATASPTALAVVQGVPSATAAAAASPAVGPVSATAMSPATTTQAATPGPSVAPVAALAPVTAQPTPTPTAPSAGSESPASESGTPAQPEAVANLPEATGPVGLPVPTRTDLVQLITDFSGSECFSASPVSTDAGGFSVESLAIASDDNDRLREAVLEAFGDQVKFQGSTITPEQCRALGFLGGAAGSVGEAVRLGVDARTIASGSTLAGILEGTAERVVHLLVVDDDGNIQAANAYTEPVGADTRFEIPLVVTGAGSTRAQILFSVVVDETMQTAAEAVDVPADKFFDALEFELIVKGLEADLSVASFVVE